MLCNGHKETAMRGRLAVIAVSLLLAAGGLWAGEPAGQNAPAGAPKADPAQPTSDAQFFAELGYKDVAMAADTARALAILISEGKETGADYTACQAYLTKRGVLPDGWLHKAAPDAPTAKGRLAILVCKALGVKGGLWMRLLGPLPRLALHECAYLEVMAAGCDYGHVTGGELVGVIDRTDRLRSTGTRDEVPELEGEPSGAGEVTK